MMVFDTLEEKCSLITLSEAKWQCFIAFGGDMIFSEYVFMCSPPFSLRLKVD